MAFTIIQQAIASNFRNIMAQQITITPHMSTADVLSALITLCGMLAHRTVKSASESLKMAWHWLNSKHDYSNEEGQIILTGWQYIGICTLVTVVTFALSIKFC